MTTAPEPLTGPALPSPCLVENPAGLNRIDHSTNKANNNTGAKEDAHPIRIGVPSSGESRVFVANVCQQDELRGVHKDELSPANKVEPERGTSPQPATARCEFTFSDGRQCRMKRAEDHGSLCIHHGSQEEAAFLPSFPELEALCGDFTTATNINHALTQVFRLLTQGRISRRDALAFGSLARLLLQTLPAIRSEMVHAFGFSAHNDMLESKLTIRPASSSRLPAKAPIQSASASRLPAKVYQQDELSPVNEVNVSEGSLRSPAPAKRADKVKPQPAAPDAPSKPSSSGSPQPRSVATASRRPGTQPLAIPQSSKVTSSGSTPTPSAAGPASDKLQPQPRAAVAPAPLAQSPEAQANEPPSAPKEAEPQPPDTPDDAGARIGALRYIGPFGPVTERVVARVGMPTPVRR